MNKKILILGDSANAYAFAKKLSTKNDIYIAPGNYMTSEFATNVDIREDAASDLLEFAMENGIDITIPSSSKSIASGIVDLFLHNNLQIFAPSQKASNFIFDKAYMKKMLYKLRIPTPKFGIFEKPNLALDYIKNQKAPFVIKTNEPSSAVILTSLQTAKGILDTSFQKNEQKVIIEDYIWGTPFCFYAITDGYKALPIGSSITYKHSLEGDGGQLTSGMGSCVPNYKLSIEQEFFIMDNIIYPLLENQERNNTTYLGIIGVTGVLTEDGTIQVIDFIPFMQDADTSAILEILDIDILKLIEACIIGSFSDEFDYIPQKDTSATSIVLNCRNKENSENSISGLDLLDEETILAFFPNVKKNKYLEYEVNTGSNLVLTTLGRTVFTATERAYNNIQNISYKGLFYRKDICRLNKFIY